MDETFEREGEKLEQMELQSERYNPSFTEDGWDRLFNPIAKEIQPSLHFKDLTLPSII